MGEEQAVTFISYMYPKLALGVLLPLVSSNANPDTSIGFLSCHLASSAKVR